jgi:hypothetical protein
MMVAFECQQCETIHVLECEPADVPDFRSVLEHDGCPDCGGHTFVPTEVPEDWDERCEGVDADCECGEHWSADYAAGVSFTLYMTEYAVWRDPMQGAVTPDLSEFFRCCNPKLPALVHWARWLRIEHQYDRGVFELPVDRAEVLLEAMIAGRGTDHGEARMMRLAFHEGFGARDADQLELPFDPSAVEA